MNLWQIESAYIARLQSIAPAGISIESTFDKIDWTDEASPSVGMHIAFDGLGPDDQRGRSAMMRLRYTAHTYLDTVRATPSERTAAQDCVRAALQAALGWEWRTGLEAKIEQGQQTGFDGRLARVSISFSVQAPEAGIA